MGWKKAETSVRFCLFFSYKNIDFFLPGSYERKDSRGCLWHGKWFLWLFLYKCIHVCTFGKPVCRWSDLWHLTVNFSNDDVVCTVCTPSPCQHSRLISRARLNTSLLKVVWDPLPLTMARTHCDIRYRTWNSWFKDMWIEKRRMRQGCWGERSLVQMASWTLLSWGSKETAGQEETRKLGNKTTERLLLNVAIIKLPEELHVSMCAGSYAVLNCKNDNNFFLFFSKGVQCSECECRLCHKGNCSLQNPVFLCDR